MSRSHFWPGVAFAAAAAVGGSLLASGLVPLIGAVGATRLVITLLALGYLIFLLTRVETGVGRISTFALWAGVALAAWVWIDSFMLFLALHVSVLWLVRALYFHSSVLAALVDGVLFAFGLVCSLGTLLKTDSTMLGIWVFFLIQALFSSLPSLRSGGAPSTPAAPERFTDAHKRAEIALATLIDQSRVY